MFLDPRILVAVSGRDLGDAFDTAADGRVGPLVDDFVGRHGDGLQARGAEPVDRRAGDRSRQARAQQSDARTFDPCWPSGYPQPMMTSSISAAATCGTRLRTAWMQWATMSSGRVILNEPRNDLANGVRKLSTTTASRATCFHSEREREKWYAEHIRSADPRGIEQNGPGCGRCRAAIVSGPFPVAGLFFAAGRAGIQRGGRAARRDRRRPPLPARMALAGRPGTHRRAASPVASRARRGASISSPLPCGPTTAGRSFS